MKNTRNSLMFGGISLFPSVEECTVLASQSVQRFLPEAARYQSLLHASHLRS